MISSHFIALVLLSLALSMAILSASASPSSEQNIKYQGEHNIMTNSEIGGGRIGKERRTAAQTIVNISLDSADRDVLCDLFNAGPFSSHLSPSFTSS